MRSTNLGLLVPSLVLLALACTTEPPPPPPPAPVASVTVSPGTPSILVGTAVQLSAATTDAQGNTLSGRAITWNSSAEATATVSAAGLVTGVSAGGPVTITATSEGQLGTAQVSVTVPPGYTLSLSDSTFSLVQGAWSPSTTVLLARSNFTGLVKLSVDNLPTGVSAGFNIFRNPDIMPAMHLFVAGNALPGTYTNLLLRGVANGFSDRTVPLMLTITQAPFILTLSSSTLSIAQGASTPTTTVNLVRHSFTGPVLLWADGYDDHSWYALPDGVTAAFSPNPATGDNSVLTLSVDAATVPGVYYVRVSGRTSTLWWEEMLTLTVTAP